MTVHRPRVVGPIAFGDTTVWVSGVTPGAVLAVHSGQNVLGQVHAADPLVSVRVQPVTGPVHAVARLANESAAGFPVEPVRDPGGAPGLPLPQTQVIESELDFGMFRVPRNDTPDGADGGFDVPLRARLYLTLGGGASRPLVVIAHGYWLFADEDPASLRGYAWLARHLARWGMMVCSIDLAAVNRQTEGGQRQQWSRGEVVYEMVRRLTDGGQTGPVADRRRVALVGHSMAGEGVVLAQALNVRRHRPFGIQGVVSLAPTNYRPEVACTHTAYMLLHGSLDYLLGGEATGPAPRFGGFRLYDRAWRPRSLAWIEGARHEGWNSIWRESQNSLELPTPAGVPELTTADQQRVGRSLITAFLLDTLAGRREYRGYMTGPARPASLGAVTVYLQHQSASVTVVDDFGDADSQAGAAIERPLAKTVNRLRRPVNATGVDVWNDVEHRTLPHSVHDTRGTDLAWSDVGGRYASQLGTLNLTEADTLSLRVCQHYAELAGEPDETWNPVGRSSDLFVELSDGSRQARIRLGVTGGIPYPLLGWEIYSVFRTVRLPLDAVAAVEPELNLGALRRIRLLLDLRSSGRILVDDVEVDQPQLTAPSRVSLLRVHDRGGFGPEDDHLESEVIVQLGGRPGESFGFALRADERLPSSRGMLALLRGALATDTPIRLEYLPAGRTAREIVAVRVG